MKKKYQYAIAAVMAILFIAAFMFNNVMALEQQIETISDEVDMPIISQDSFETPSIILPDIEGDTSVLVLKKNKNEVTSHIKCQWYSHDKIYHTPTIANKDYQIEFGRKLLIADGKTLAFDELEISGDSETEEWIFTKDASIKAYILHDVLHSEWIVCIYRLGEVTDYYTTTEKECKNFYNYMRRTRARQRTDHPR